jgi:hypothetical protein
MTTTHANLSPSKRHRWSQCPASIKVEAQYPEERSGAAAVDGTHTHTVLSHCIEKDVAQAASLIGTKMSDHDGEFVIDSARAERVQFALDYIDKRWTDLGGRVLSEVKVDLSPIFGRSDLNGTADVVILGDAVIEVIDYKDGMGVVSAEDNLQMDQYAWGIVAQLGIENLTQKSIRMTIIQPKLREKGMDGISYTEMTMDEFLSGRDRLAQQAAATDDPNAHFVPGEKQCQWCRHKGACSALAQQNMAALGLDLSAMNVAHDAADKDPTTMTDQQLRELIEAAPLIRKMLEAAETEALNRLNAGKSIDGLKLVRGRGSRGWAYDEAAMAEKLVRLGIPKGEIYRTSLISPAQAEKLTWKKRDGTVMQLNERKLKTLHEEYVTSSEGKLQVASEADSRPAVVRDVSSMFGSVGGALPDFLQVPDWLK